LEMQWSKEISGCQSISTGDWDGNGVTELLVLDDSQQIHIISPDGTVKTRIRIPEPHSKIELGHHSLKGARFLAYSNWGQKVAVLGMNGEELWEYRGLFGVNSAHWGDLDCDGSDELIIGMNGSGGIHAVSCDGELIWHVSDIGNAWNQAVVSCTSSSGAMVISTEASGTIRMYDRNGINQEVFRPLDGYYAPLDAAKIDPAGNIQVVALSNDSVVAINTMGDILWSTIGIKNHGYWRGQAFAHGDLDGNQTHEWVFMEKKNELIATSFDGVKIASLPVEDIPAGFAIVPSSHGNGILVIADSNGLKGYRLL